MTTDWRGSTQTLHKLSTLCFTCADAVILGSEGAWSVPIRLVPLSLVVSRTLVSLPFLTGVG